MRGASHMIASLVMRTQPLDAGRRMVSSTK